MKKFPKVVFCGCWGLGKKALETVCSSCELVAVFTTSPLDGDMWRSAVWDEATKIQGVQIFAIDSSDWESKLESIAPKCELLISCAFPFVIKENILNSFLFGGINVHQSVLPKHRGRSPVDAVMLSGDLTAGISIHRMTARVDEGQILGQSIFSIQANDTKSSLLEKMKILLPSLLDHSIREAITGSIGIANVAESNECLFKGERVPWNLSVEEIRGKLNSKSD